MCFSHLRHVFFNGFNQTNSKNYVYELHLASGTTRIIIIGIIVVVMNILRTVILKY